MKYDKSCFYPLNNFLKLADIWTSYRRYICYLLCDTFFDNLSTKTLSRILTCSQCNFNSK